MKYLVIGLGNLGRAIAKDLTRVGNEVIGVDMDLHRVDMLKNDIAGDRLGLHGQRGIEHPAIERDGCHYRNIR